MRPPRLPRWLYPGMHLKRWLLLLFFGITVLVYLWNYRSAWGSQMRAVVQNREMAAAVGIDTERIDRLSFGIGCGIAGVAGSAFTMLGSTGPTSAARSASCHCSSVTGRISGTGRPSARAVIDFT